MRTMRKGNGVVNGEVMMEEGDWETTITSPETERTGSTKLRFPNPAKFKSDFSAIYQIDKSGVRSRSIQVMNSDHIIYSQENTDPTRRVKAPEGKNCDFKAFTDSAGLFLKF